MSSSGGIYDNGFEAYRDVTTDEYRSVLTAGLVVLDANALLNLYRYHTRTRNDLIEVFTSIKERLWVSSQAISEFWKARLTVIDNRSKEIEDVVNGILEDEARIKHGIRTWANRVGVPREQKDEILQSVENGIAVVVGRIRGIGAHEAIKDSSATDDDPVLAALEGILDQKVGEPLAVDIVREVKKEALQRIVDKRPPGWKDANKKENKEGDYVVWYETLQEAKRRAVDVLFVTDDVKEDWWRIEHGQTKGPLPELVREMRDVANVRLLMVRTETFLLHASKLLGRDVSNESVRDVQRVSSEMEAQWEAARSRIAIDIYHAEVRDAIEGLGYFPHGYREDVEFDFTITRHGSNRTILCALLYSQFSLSRNAVETITKISSTFSSFPVIIISNSRLTESALKAIEDLGNVSVVQWRDKNDNGRLKTALEQIFAF